jgi:hypothetical protein
LYIGGRGRKIVVIGQPHAKVRPYMKNKTKAKRACGVAQGRMHTKEAEGPECKP